MDIEQAWQRRSEELTREFVELDVYDAVVRFPHDRSKFYMLERVAGMQMMGGETPYQRELRRKLAEVCNGQETNCRDGQGSQAPNVAVQRLGRITQDCGGAQGAAAPRSEIVQREKVQARID